MIDAVVAKLKKGSIKNVVILGQTALPAPPYVVVKEEPQATVGRTFYRVIVHVIPAQYLVGRRYARTETVTLLANKLLTSQDAGVRNTIYNDESMSGPILQNDDKTVAFERMFFIRDIF